MNGAQFREENENRSSSPDVLPKTSNLVISRYEGSLSKDDGYGNENGSPKYNLAISQVFRDYSVLFNLHNTSELSCNWMGTNGFKDKTENDCFVFICSRCRQNLRFVDFTSLFCGVRQRKQLDRENNANSFPILGWEVHYCLFIYLFIYLLQFLAYNIWLKKK